MNSFAYSLSQRLLAPGAEDRLCDLLRDWFSNHPGARGRLLDVGCGPVSWLEKIGLRPVGVDLQVSRNTARVAASATHLPFPEQSFDSVWNFGLLHHLDDGQVKDALSEMWRVARRGGYVVMFDAVLPEPAWKRPVAATLRALDRGQWMRRQPALEALLASTGSWRRQRLTYAWTGLEGLFCWTRKGESDASGR